MFYDLFYIYSERKIILIGLDNAGKTTILYQLYGFLSNYKNTKIVNYSCLTYLNILIYNSSSVLKEAMQTSPTIGSNVEEVRYKNLRFIMWDIGGQESLRAAWQIYYANTE